jgi:DNA-binding transcriptional ArsR family regulator
VPHEALRQALVGRALLLERLVADFAASVHEGGARYVVVVGPRGSGKSHLTALVRATLRERLGGAAIVVALDEEEHVASLVDLFARVLRAFPDEPDLPTPAVQLQALRRGSADEAVERAVGMIEARLGERPLILSFENADHLFDDLGRTSLQVLRRVLQTHPRWSVLATSRTLGPAFLKPQQPFFNTFAAEVLGPFSPEDCREQLARLADLDGVADLAGFLRTPVGLARVRAIHHFTGGNPRAMALVYPYLSRSRLDALIDAFYDLADELTPYFQEQMARLAPGQRPIIEALAENWRPMSPSEIADRLFLSQQVVSAQLKRLREDRVVGALAVGRERFYEIAEPLHRLARAMKRTDGVGEALARFLRHWHDPAGLDRALDDAGGLAVAANTDITASPAIEQLRDYFGLPAGCLPDALLALPTDVRPYARLAAEERAAVRLLLKSYGATDRLSVLPAEPNIG